VFLPYSYDVGYLTLFSQEIISRDHHQHFGITLTTSSVWSMCTLWNT